MEMCCEGEPGRCLRKPLQFPREKGTGQDVLGSDFMGLLLGQMSEAREMCGFHSWGDGGLVYETGKWREKQVWWGHPVSCLGCAGSRQMPDVSGNVTWAAGEMSLEFGEEFQKWLLRRGNRRASGGSNGPRRVSAW